MLRKTESLKEFHFKFCYLSTFKSILFISFYKMLQTLHLWLFRAQSFKTFAARFIFIYDMITWHCTWQDQETSRSRIVCNVLSRRWHWNVLWKGSGKKKHTYDWWKGLPMPSFRSWRGRNGVIMPNGTRNSRNFQISRKRRTSGLWRLSTIFEMSFQKRSVRVHSILFQNFWSSGSRPQYTDIQTVL